MELTLVRTERRDTCTIGELFVEEKFECYTLEDKERPYPDKVKALTAIWPGTYKVVIDYSNRFKKDMPHVLDVPLFEGVRIHPGNTAADTEGCILVGKTKDVDRIGQSKQAYAELLVQIQAAIKRGEEVTIKIT